MRQPGQVRPPQSISVSVPLTTPSLHDPARQMPESHTQFKQSDASTQLLPCAQPGHASPQSMSVSVPFFMPSKHVGGGTHRPASQRSLWQSELVRQAPEKHGEHTMPPQSISVSKPFFMPSTQ